MTARKPLDGVTVVELGHSVSAPFAGLILADLGARVIKVENPGTGDYARNWGPPFWKESSSLFAALNRGKEGIAVDFNDKAAMEALIALIVDQADAVLQNLRPGILDKYGIDAATLRARKPSLIWCDIGAFGSTGPFATKPGYDPLVQASSGIMSITGEGDRPPVRVGVSIIDMGSAMWSVIGMLAALLERGKSGQGMQVGTSLYETGLAWMTIPLAGYEASGDIRKPFGSGVAEIVPHQAFATADGWLMIAAGNDGLFRKLCGVLALGHLADDPDFRNNDGRVRNRERLVPQIEAVALKLTSEELGSKLDAAGVPNAPLLTIDQVARHPQTQALRMTVSCPDDPLDLMGVPLAFDGERPRAITPAPRLGQHNDVLQRRSGR